MKFVHSVFLLCLSFLFFACPTFEGESKKDKSILPLKVIIFVDKSGSIESGNIPKIKQDDLKPFIDYIHNYGGELSLSSIGNISTKHLEHIRNEKVEKPDSDLKPGESGNEYFERLEEYKKRSKNEKSIEELNAFLYKSEIKNVLNYTSLESSSDIVGAINLANFKLNEIDHFWKEIRKVAIFVSDGIETANLSSLPANFCCELIIVNRNENRGLFEEFPNYPCTSMQSAYQYIMSKK